jgi:restriction endonuclease S subunit
LVEEKRLWILCERDKHITILLIHEFGGSLCGCAEICIYSVRVSSRLKNKIPNKLILFFDIWNWLRIKFESGYLSLSWW